MRMENIIAAGLFLVGLAALVWGGDNFVEAASYIAERTGIPKFIIGATVVSVATTLPELFVSLMATMEGSVDMAVGNAVGSVSANMGLILGISLLVLPGCPEDGGFWKKALLMIAATIFLAVSVTDGTLALWESAVLLILLALFIRQNLCGKKETAGSPRKSERLGGHVAEFFLGLGGILLGANLLVDNGARIARMFGAPEALIGLTLVAVGTSLPELITTVTALAKGEPSLSVGNIVGANVIDITLILSLCAFTSGGTLTVAERTASLDLPVALALMMVAVLPALLRKKFSRWQGALLLMIYGSYISFVTLIDIL